MEQKQRKKVLFAEMPIVTRNTIVAALCLVGSSQIGYKAWLLNNFIQIKHGFVFQDIHALDSSPLVKNYIMPKNLISKEYDDYITFVEKCIDNDLYLYHSFDTYFNSSYVSYGRIHKTHPLLIYGYDKNDKVFYTAGFYDFLTYEFKKCSYEELYLSFAKIEDYFPPRSSEVHLFKAVYNEVIFSLEMVVSLLEDYLFSRNTYLRMDLTKSMHLNEIFGLDSVYHEIKIINNIKSTNEGTFYKLKSLYTFQTQKKIMLMRLDYMKEENIISEEEYDEFYKPYQQLESICAINISLAIKYNMFKEKSILDRIIEKINVQIELEQNIMPKLISCLKNKIEDCKTV